MSCQEVLEREGIAGPHDVVTTHHRHLVPRPRSASEARAFARGLDLPLEEDGHAVLLLLLTELVTNAVLHARTTVELGVTITDAVVLVTVTDHNESRPEQRPYGELFGTGGRGLLMVEELSQRWGVLFNAGGKTVWFTLGRSRLPRHRRPAVDRMEAGQ